jgi:UDP-N-acetylglucosamine 2-epimerase (non-hydrolysing)
MKTAMVVFGTRPEAIKMAPVIHALRQTPDLKVIVCVTGQHRQMLDDALKVFNIQPDIDLDIMRPGQTLAAITTAILEGLDSVLQARKPDILLVHGDTTSSFAAALAGFYRRIPVGHVEAGLRTGNMGAPWPEEFNRRSIDLFAQLLWAPTKRASDALLLEGVEDKRISITGNTVIDALLIVRDQIVGNAELRQRLEAYLPPVDVHRKTILVTGHRRENFDGGIMGICLALNELAKRDDVQIVWPLHPNPAVREAVEQTLARSSNVKVTEPLDYVAFVAQMMRADFIITDSGGIQEEAPSLGKPVLVTRDETERPEAIEAGTALLVGTSSKRIVAEASRLLDDPKHYRMMASALNPFGDGQASKRIASDVAEGQWW